MCDLSERVEDLLKISEAQRAQNGALRDELATSEMTKKAYADQVINLGRENADLRAKLAALSMVTGGGTFNIF